MPVDTASQARGEVFFMVISALIFGYFGFANSWAHQMTTTSPPQLLVMVVVLKWTLRAGAIAFGLSAVIALAGSLIGPLIYALAGLATAGLFVVVAIWEKTNPQGYYSGIPAFWLIIFALWNGYGAWQGLRTVMALRRRGAPGERFGGA